MIKPTDQRANRRATAICPAGMGRPWEFKTRYHQVDDWPGMAEHKKKVKWKWKHAPTGSKLIVTSMRCSFGHELRLLYVCEQYIYNICVRVSRSHSRSSQKVRLHSVHVLPAMSLSRRAKANKQNHRKFVLSASRKIIVVPFVRLYNFQYFHTLFSTYSTCFFLSPVAVVVIVCRAGAV